MRKEKKDLLNRKQSMTKKVLCGVLSSMAVVNTMPVSALTMNTMQNETVNSPSNVDYTNVIMNVGENDSQRYVSWNSDKNNANQLVLWESGNENAKRTITVEAEAKTGVAGQAFFYHATITDLESNKSYSYKIGSDEAGWSNEYTFKTGVEGDNKFNFIFAGDPQLGNASQGWQRTLDKIMEWEPNQELIVTLGDQIDSGSNAKEYNDFTAPKQLKEYPVAVNLGNHETYGSKEYSDHYVVPNRNDDSSTLSEKQGEDATDYWFEHDGVLFMSLNSNKSDSASIDGHERFMRKAMQDYKDEYGKDPVWKIVTFHHSIYSSASHVNDSDVVRMRQELPPIFTELGVDAVLMGHDHVYTRTFLMEGTTPVDTNVTNEVLNPEYGQVLYVTANSASGSKFYNITSNQYPWSAVQNQEKVPNITSVKVSENELTFTTYRTGANNSKEDVVDTYSIKRDKAKPENPITTKEVVSTENTDWKYLDNNTDPGTKEDEKAWTKADYDDSKWKSAKGSFGAKNGNHGDHAGHTENTLLNQYEEDGKTNIPSYFFRTTFDVENPSNVTSLTGKALYDDGAIVYINGVKVAGFNDGNIKGNMSYNNALSSSNAASGEFNVGGKALQKLNLKEKGNVIAVELHNESATSSDIFLDMQSVDIRVDSRDDVKAPVINISGNMQVLRGSSFNKMSGVSATDNRDGDLTEYIEVTGDVDTSKAGDYTLIYTVTDLAGNKTTKERKVTVKKEIGYEFEDAKERSRDVNPDNKGGMKNENLDGGITIGNTFDGAWFHFDKLNIKDESLTKMNVRYSAAPGRVFNDARVELHAGDENGELLATVPLELTSSWSDFKTASINLDKETSNKILNADSLSIVLRGTREPDKGLIYPGNFNWFTFDSVKNSINKDILSSLISEVSKLDSEKYTVSSWKAFSTVLENAKTVLAKEDATQDDVDNAVTALNDAKEALVKRATNELMEVLSEEVTKAEALKDDYTEEEFKDVQAAIDAAKALMNNPEEAGSIEAVNALVTLQKAVSDLPEAPSADKLREDLTETIKYVKENILNDTEGLRPGKVQELKDAVAEAEKLVADPEATAEQLSASLTKVTEKVQELWEIVNKDELNAVITSAKAISKEGYTEESYNSLQEAIAAAEKVAGNDDATTAQVKDAISSVAEAIANLEKEAVLDKTALEKEIGLVEKMVENIDDYVAGTVKGLEDKLNQAKDVLANATTQKQIDEATAMLREARLNARVKADKEALKEAIETAGKYDLSKYTKESGEALRTALSKAEKVLKDEAATQKEVDAAVNELNKAAEKLVLKASVPAGADTDKPENGNTPVKTGVTSHAGAFAGMLAAATGALLALKKRKDSER